MTRRLGLVIVSLGILAPTVNVGAQELQHYKNSPDMECESGQQCSESQFEAEYRAERSKWAITPQEIKTDCAGQPTLPTLEECVIHSSLNWFAAHPNETAPWLPGA